MIEASWLWLIVKHFDGALECCSPDKYFRSMSCIWHHIISLSATLLIPQCSARRVGWSGSGIYVWAVRFLHGDNTVRWGTVSKPSRFVPRVGDLQTVPLPKIEPCLHRPSPVYLWLNWEEVLLFSYSTPNSNNLSYLSCFYYFVFWVAD